MRIIQQYGRRQITCPKCSSILEVCADDVELDESGHIMGYYCTCPVCKNPIPLEIDVRWIKVVEAKYA